jgi:hypothetical protein
MAIDRSPAVGTIIDRSIGRSLAIKGTHPMSRFGIAALLVLAWFSSATHTVYAKPRDKIVTAEGRASGDNANAMEQARLDALRRAVQQACGEFINAQTVAKNYAAVYDRVMGSAAGYVTESEVVSRKVEDGVSICTVKATVSTESFESEWTRLAHTLEREDNPRCIVVVIEDDDADDQNPPKTGAVVQSALENFFLSKGVQIMDKGATDDIRKRDVTLADMNNNPDKLAAMAASFKADVLVTGNAQARRSGASELAGQTIYRWQTTLNVKAYHADSAQMLSSNTYSTTKAGPHEIGGGDAALKACVDQHGAAILRDIAQAWSKRQFTRRSIQLTLENCSRKDFLTFEKALAAVDGVQGVRLRELVNNVCQIEVDWSYDIATLAGRLDELKAGGYSLDITEQSHDRLTARLTK